ncbi:myristoyl transferase [Paenibacillus sp. LMG 31461]|uniref:Myristoyl transferase n=1 Tax=Paenibacillus plantarum TaxID=2654975 RepID=A0ABX1XIH3_9BACL|nr:ABC transporter substrate-binding protein [Paenibacillus plantarum]NOU67703.1 myristoyl transferase [Paenibacillus plantarum]
MKKNTQLLGALVAVSLFSIVVGCGKEAKPVSQPVSTPAAISGNAIQLPPAEKSEVTLRLNWKIKGEFAPFFVAIDKGFYEKYGLKVNVLEGNGSADTLKTVSLGKEEFGINSGVEPAQGLAENMKVQMIGSFMTKSPLMIVSFPGSPIKTPKDLEGRKIAMNTTSTFSKVFPKFMESQGVDASKVTQVKVDSSGISGLFLTKQVQAAEVFASNDYPKFELKSEEKLDTLLLSDYGFDIPGLTMIANTDFLKANPNTTKRFLAAISEAFEYTLKNREESVQILKKHFPDVLDVKVTLAQINRTAELIEVSPTQPIGWMDEKKMQQTLTLLEDTGFITKKVDINQYFTNEYLPKK